MSTYVAALLLRKGKVTIGDMANAALAGGVAIGATCNLVSGALALTIGAVAGALCVLGYAVIQPALQKRLKIVDTCGVHNLHGMPGLLGGIIAAVVIPAVAAAQLAGIVVTVAVALTGGIVSGFVLRALGSKRKAYEDADEFAVAEEPPIAMTAKR